MIRIMNKKLLVFGLAGFVYLGVVCHTIAQETGVNHTENTRQLTFPTLLQELIDRNRLAIYPDGRWTQHQASSYDRDSKTELEGTWDVNQDWNNYVRQEIHKGREEYVLMDVKGPGVITHYWTGGNPNLKSYLRFYVDGEDTPFWEADHPGALIGENRAIGIPLSQRSSDGFILGVDNSRTSGSSGHNLYAPIPFNERMKITSDMPHGNTKTGIWYIINYRLYHEDISAESFSEETPGMYIENLNGANRKLIDFMALSPREARLFGEKKIKKQSFSINPSDSKTLEISDPGAIKRIFLSLQSDNKDEAITNTWIQIGFDGKQTVNLPIGFLFGCGDQLVKVKDWFRKVDENGNMAVFWIMPYRENAVIRLLNKGDKTISGSMEVALGNWDWNENSMYFHTNFKRMDSLKTERHKITLVNYLTLENQKGVYVGDMLQIRKYFDGWWGEGDERIYIDGGDSPDHNGTGTEDYYGYAWGNPKLFNHIFNTQPVCIDMGNRINSRVRSLDAIPFENSFRFDMESLNNFGGMIDYNIACYWYGKPK